MELDHTITIGQTKMGKSVLNKKLAAWYKSQGIKVVVLDPLNDPGWNADFMTRNPEEFLALVKDPDKCLQCALFIDEAGMSLDKYATEYQWLTCQSRHHGHVTHIIAQRAQMISATVRSQCSVLNVFAIGPKDAAVYAEDFNCPTIREASGLSKGEVIHVKRAEPAKRYNIFT